MDPEEWCHVRVFNFIMVRLNTCTLPHSAGSMFEIDFQTGETIFRFELNFKISKLYLRFQINSNRFSSFGHNIFAMFTNI